MKYLEQRHFESMFFTAEALRDLVAETSASQIVPGGDYPYQCTSVAVEQILTTPDLSDEARIAMLGGTANTLVEIEP